MPAPAFITPALASLNTALLSSIRIGPATANTLTLNQTLTIAAGALSSVTVTTTAQALTGSTSFVVTALVAAIPAGAQFFLGSVLVTTTATASAAATTIVCLPLVAGIAQGVTAPYLSVAVASTASAIPANFWFTLSNGARMKTLVAAPAGASALNLQLVQGTIVNATTSTYNLFVTIPVITDLNVQVPKGTITSLQYFGVAVGVQAKAGLTPQTIVVGSTGSDVDPGITDLKQAALSAAAPTSTRGFIITLSDGSVFWGYADVADFTPDTSNPTNILKFSFNLAVREFYEVRADAV